MRISNNVAKTSLYWLVISSSAEFKHFFHFKTYFYVPDRFCTSYLGVYKRFWFQIDTETFWLSYTGYQYNKFFKKHTHKFQHIKIIKVITIVFISNMYEYCWISKNPVFSLKKYTLRKIPKFHLVSWRQVSGKSLRKLSISTKFPQQENRWVAVFYLIIGSIIPLMNEIKNNNRTIKWEIL